MAENENVGFEGGMAALPTNVLREASPNHSKERLRHQKHRPYRQRDVVKQPPAEPLSASTAKNGSKNRQKYYNRAAGGPGMQAIFLNSGKRSCGTGVFLPRGPATKDRQLNTKPACSPVLLPARVVQALNLNVHQLALQIKPQEINNKLTGGLDGDDGDNNNSGNYNKKTVGNNDVSTHCSVISQNRSASPEIFLPKEWTY